MVIDKMVHNHFCKNHTQTNIKQSLKQRPFPWTACRSSEGQNNIKRINECSSSDTSDSYMKMHTSIPETAELSSQRIYMTSPLMCPQFSSEQRWMGSWGIGRYLSSLPFQASTEYLQAKSEEALTSKTDRE